jgi:M6 family metalloprotease-like protein
MEDKKKSYKKLLILLAGIELCVFLSSLVDSQLKRVTQENASVQENSVTTESSTESSTETTTESTETEEDTSNAKGTSSFSDGVVQTLEEGRTPAVGTVPVLFFVVDFSDMTFEDDIMSTDEIKSTLFDENTEGSFARFITNASYGKMHVTGEVYRYTAAEKNTDYQADTNGYEKLAMEVLDNFDDEIDYSQYDSNNDGYIDCFVLNIAGSDNYWYGSQFTWYDNYEYSVDGVYPSRFIIDDAQPLDYDSEYYVQEMCHEFGHCMGLEDYYKPDVEDDYDAMHGIAGTEMMDEMTGDYSSYSKLMLGWIDEDKINVYTGGTQTYTISSAQTEGGCILIPRNAYADNIYESEFMLVEYNTSEGNLETTISDAESGVRVLHCESEVFEDEYGEKQFKYNMFSSYYDKSNEGIQILKMVDDDSDYKKAGDVIDDTTSGMAWYDDDQKATVATGITITIDEIADGQATITVSSNS